MAGLHRFVLPRGARRQPWLNLFGAALLASTIAACAEDLGTGAACPALCPGTDVPLRDTVIEALSLERVVPGVLLTGTEPELLLADRGDTLQTRIVIRFDSLTTRYRAGTDTATTAVTALDSTYLRLAVISTQSVIPESFVVRAYDVTAAGDDTTAAPIEAQLVPARRLAEQTFTRAQAKDSIRIAISDSAVFAAISRTEIPARALRIALTVESADAVMLRVVGTNGGSFAPRLEYRPNASTSTYLRVAPRSRVPASDAVAAIELADYVTMPVRPAQPDPAFLAVGGLPARRTYLRLTLPSAIIDSATIVSAELRLVQRPSSLPDSIRTFGDAGTPRRDTVVVLPLIGLAGSSVTDPVRAAQLAQRALVRVSGGGALIDSLSLGALRLAPRDSGLRRIDIGRLVRRWRDQQTDAPRAIVLAAESEGTQLGTVLFYSSSATDPLLRPRLVIRYIPRVGYGLP